MSLADRGERDLISRSTHREVPDDVPFDLPTADVSTNLEVGPPEATGELWVNEAVNIRSEPSARSAQLAVAQRGDVVAITGASTGDWTQLVWDEREAWVRTSYLTDSEPEDQSPVTADDSQDGADEPAGSESNTAAEAEPNTTAQSGGGTSSGACPISGEIEASLTANAIGVYRSVCGAFPGVASSYGGYRAGDSGDHGSGRAVDIMVSGSAGWDIARYVQANAGSLGVTYVIYEQRIWLAGNPHSAWEPMADRGGATANHYDHVHVSVN